MNYPMTPWGIPDNAINYAEGIVFYETSSHGGFHLSDGRISELPANLRTPDHFYEEDCEAAVVFMQFPEICQGIEHREKATETFNMYYPDGFKPWR